MTRVPWKGEQDTNPIRAVRKRSGLTQREAAERSGIPLGTIRKLEDGTRQPNAENLRRLSLFYGVTADVLLGLEPLDHEGDA